jgi:crotonobetainyl-CoA:carnitine CoA-transferase CaiB-like acyl-CoA transferase
VAELAPQNTCVAPVYEIPELVDDPHFVERGVFMEAEDPENGCFRQVAPILAGGIREQPKWQVRSPNESDAQNLLEEVGYGVDEIEELRRTGAVD